MSGLPPVALELRTSLEVRFVPGTDSSTALQLYSITLSHRATYPVFDKSKQDDVTFSRTFNMHDRQVGLVKN